MTSKKIEEMSFAEWQLVLSEGTPEDAWKVWTTLKGKPLQMVAHILTIDTTGKVTKMMLAGSSDYIDAKRGDIDLTMAAAIPKKDMPKEDTDLQFEGTPVSYVAMPAPGRNPSSCFTRRAATSRPSMTNPMTRPARTRR